MTIGKLITIDLVRNYKDNFYETKRKINDPQIQNICTNNLYFLNEDYLFKKIAMAIIVRTKEGEYIFYYNSKFDVVQCNKNDEIVHKNIRRVNSIYKMFIGGIFE